MMTIFNRLAPYIQDYIYRSQWTEMRAVQVAACDILFNTEDHILLTSGTASGKTEAAFLPALTLLHESPSSSVGILYLSPLKALINDQFTRLNPLLEEGNIPVCKWHSDAPGSAKTKLLRTPQGVLQITPESLESLMINKRESCLRLFRDLRFVVIDEVHYFMASPRGIQLICLLERIEKLTACAPRRIGLSATLSDTSSARQWLRAGTNRSCQAPSAKGSPQKLALYMQRFVPGKDAAGPESAGRDENIDTSDTAAARYYDFLYQSTLNKKAIIFANSRAAVESTIAHLRQTAYEQKTPDIYRVHHGSISAPLRAAAEKDMRESVLPIVTGATVTLELGIDIGSLDRIIQIGAPLSVSSFTQRLGRCGRQGQTAELVFALLDNEPPAGSHTLQTINWEFLKTIAVIQLRLEEKWVEPLSPPTHPFALLYHQTMSYLLANGDAVPAALAQNVLGLQAFRHISREDYKILLRHLLTLDHLQRTERGRLIIGAKAEALVTHYQFYAVFESTAEYEVTHQGEAIGSVMEAYPAGTHFALAGKAWRTVGINEQAKTLFVEEASGVPNVNWISPSQADLHTRMLQKIKHILQAPEDYAYLSPSCQKRLLHIRHAARLTGAAQKPVIPLAEGRFAVFPWAGTRALHTLLFALEQQGIPTRVMPGGWLPIYLETDFTGDTTQLLDRIKTIITGCTDKYSFDLPDHVQIPHKFNQFIPEILLAKEFVEDYLDIDGMKQACSSLLFHQ